MGRGYLNEEEVAELSRNRYVDIVKDNNIYYTRAFKKHFMERYNAGEKPTQIFREAGFDTSMLGDKRIERAASRWRQLYAAAGYEAFDNPRVAGYRRTGEEGPEESFVPVSGNRSHAASRSDLTDEIQRLKNTIADLFLENTELRKKLIENEDSGLQTAPEKRLADEPV